ncbi:hypothetical protein H6F44_07860 [Pseudanabaena sp. FACHB-1277]|uniref:Uncharacterized protein n=1 Tax=Pseudanabaena cinerea FACHB-1277 TaxID=2949581 RepID=A0A926Z5W5_9CYAN|nr:hypothetical protein [Pseudanabaena cinerea]MBD2150037.1 hypothetical protein [Pseudanabaena cinerea FACHB-1277]
MSYLPLVTIRPPKIIAAIPIKTSANDVGVMVTIPPINIKTTDSKSMMKPALRDCGLPNKKVHMPPISKTRLPPAASPLNVNNDICELKIMF